MPLATPHRNDVTAASRGISRSHRWKLADRRFPTRKTVERLGLCHAGFPPCPRAVASKAPRLSSGTGYSRRGRCRRLHITRGHIAHQHLTVNVPHRICVQNRLTAETATTHAGSQRLRVFRSSTNGGALRCKTRRHWLCRWRSEAANDVAAASRGFSRPHRREFADRRFPTRKAMQRLGLCRVGFPRHPPNRRPQSAKTLFWQGLSETLPMSPLARHCAATSLTNI